MITGRPLFPGSTVEDELHLIFRILGEAAQQRSAEAFAFAFLFVPSASHSFHLLIFCGPAGTPTEESWPGITTSEEFKTYNFPQYQAEPLVSHAPRHAI